MAFEYLGGSGTTDLFNLLFREILKISPTLLYKYSTMQDQIIYLFLIPTVILFLFIFAFAKGIVGRVIGEHKGFEYLISIVSYIYLVYSGMFGNLLVPLLTAWLQIAIVIALVVFLMSVIIHPARGPALVKLAGDLGGTVNKKVFEKGKKVKALDKEIEALDKLIANVDDQLARPGSEHRAIAALQVKRASLEHQKKALEIERDRL